MACVVKVTQFSSILWFWFCLVSGEWYICSEIKVGSSTFHLFSVRFFAFFSPIAQFLQHQFSTSIFCPCLFLYITFTSFYSMVQYLTSTFPLSLPFFPIAQFLLASIFHLSLFCLPISFHNFAYSSYSMVQYLTSTFHLFSSFLCLFFP